MPAAMPAIIIRDAIILFNVLRTVSHGHYELTRVLQIDFSFIKIPITGSTVL